MIRTAVTIACLLAASVSLYAQQPAAQPSAVKPTRATDDYELFLENIMNAPRGQRKVWNGKCYNGPYKCDPTQNIAPNPCPGGVCPLAPTPRPVPIDAAKPR